MEKMEKEANVLSVEERLEAEKQEKINEVIQNAKAEESSLELMATAPATCEQCFDEIRDNLTKGDLGDMHRTYIHKGEFKANGGNSYRNVEITLDRRGDEEEITIYFEYLDGKAWYGGKDREHSNFYYKKEKDESGNTEIRRKNLDNRSYGGLRKLKDEYGLKDMQLNRTLVDSAQYDEELKPNKQQKNGQKNF